MTTTARFVLMVLCVAAIGVALAYVAASQWHEIHTLNIPLVE
jgi:hypothetical protein